MSLIATWRRSGSRCSARYTAPMPPLPSALRMWKGPIWRYSPSMGGSVCPSRPTVSGSVSSSAGSCMARPFLDLRANCRRNAAETLPGAGTASGPGHAHALGADVEQPALQHVALALLEDVPRPDGLD